MDVILTIRDEYLKVLVEYLGKRGFGPTEILQLIRDVAHILANNRFVTCSLVNGELAHLGWDQPTLDEIGLSKK